MENLQFINPKKIAALSNHAAALVTIFTLSACAGCVSSPPKQKYYSENLTITATQLNSINARIFGKVLEKSAVRELGPELVVDLKTGRLPTNVLALIKDTHSPLLVFPGPDADQSDWRDSINNAPEKKRFRPLLVSRPDGRQINTRFGIDEFGRMKQELGFEAVLVVNLLDGLARKGPVREAAERAAGLIAYCNGQYAVKLPRALRHWPGIRAKNGNPIPFQVEYVQLGSHLDSAAYQSAVSAALPHFDTKQLAQWYVDCLTVYIQHIRSADPTIKIILDAEIAPDITATVYQNSYIAENINVLAVSAAGPDTPDSLSRYADIAKTLGKPIAVTEWIGAASILDSTKYLNALIRHGASIEFAAQSPLLGQTSPAAVIRIPKAPNESPNITATGAASALYARHHGRHRLEVTRKNQQDSGELDIVVTASETAIYLHAVNSSPTRRARIVADCSAHKVADSFSMRSLTSAGASTTSTPIRSTRKIPVVLPPESVSVITLPLKP